MAFSLFNSGAAQAYANSFSPWKANGGYDKVKSEIGKDIFTQIPFLNFKAEVEMAKAGLAGYTGATKQKMVTDSNERINEAKIDFYDRDREDTQKENRKGAIARMLGGGGSAAGAIANRGSASEILRQTNGGSALEVANSMTNADRSLTADIYNRNAQGIKAVETALQVTGSSPQSSGTQLRAPTTQQVTLQTPSAAPVSSSKQEVDKVKQLDAYIDQYLKQKSGGK